MVYTDDMSRARRALEGQSLRFAFLDGAVDEICPYEDEDLWALNVKRGVLTAFQNSMRQLEKEEHVQEVGYAVFSAGGCGCGYWLVL
jgi:hypothetical protein